MSSEKKKIVVRGLNLELFIKSDGTKKESEIIDEVKAMLTMYNVHLKEIFPFSPPLIDAIDEIGEENIEIQD